MQFSLCWTGKTNCIDLTTPLNYQISTAITRKMKKSERNVFIQEENWISDLGEKRRKGERSEKSRR